MTIIVNRKNFIDKLKKKNEKALEYIIREYGGYVKAAIYHNLSELPEDMEECMDDVFLDVWEHVDRYDASKGSFKNWIISIARFRSIDYLRRYRRKCMEEDISNYENELEQKEVIDTLNHEISEETERLLSGLKDDDRNILLQYYIDELDVNTIAKMNGLSISAIYSKVSRAKKKVREWRMSDEERV